VQLVEGLMVANRFRLIRELGRGGMGSVWLAEHTGLEALCALKLIDPRGKESAELRGRFQREARAAAHIRSRHVVQILDHGVWEDIPYIAMEYLQGEDLADRLDRGRLSHSETVRILSQVARALTRAHGAGIIHRDLKPENVFLAQEDEGEIAKVLDFGIAKRASMELGDSATKTGSLVGTPFYMSPEQARGAKQLDHRSDLWALAVIAYECVTGEAPFAGEGLGEVLGKIMYEPLPVPSQVAPDLPSAFDTWWLRAAARNPEERFQSAAEATDALALALRVTQTFDVRPLLSIPDRESLSSDPLIVGSRASQDAALVETFVAETPRAPSETADPISHTFAPRQRPSRAGRWLMAGAGALLLVAAGPFLLHDSAEPKVVAGAGQPFTPPPKPAAEARKAPEVIEAPTPEPATSDEVTDEPIVAPEASEAAVTQKTATVPKAPPRAPARRPARKPSTRTPTAKSTKTVDFGI
jgi:serine/threonine-protein kinase